MLLLPSQRGKTSSAPTGRAVGRFILVAAALCGATHGFTLSRHPSHFLRQRLVTFSESVTESEPVAVAKKRGRPKKNVIADDGSTPVDVKPVREKRPRSSKPKYITGKEILDPTRKLLTTALIIVRGEGLPGDQEVIDSLKAKCEALYGDKLVVVDNQVVNVEEEEDPDFPEGAVAKGPTVQETEGEEDDLSDEDEIFAASVVVESELVSEFGDMEESAEEEMGESAEEDYIDVEDVNEKYDEPDDPELIEIWVESYAKVLRLASRRSKNPLELSAEFEDSVMAGVAEYMEEGHELVVECFRDETNMPELS